MAANAGNIGFMGTSASAVVHDCAPVKPAHGGKDRHPFPVPIKVYDETIRVLRSGVDKAKLGHQDALFALRKLDAE
jgi:hypothetical protein